MGQLIGGPAACLPAAVNPTVKYLSVERQCCPHLVRSSAHLLATGVTWVFFVSPETRRIHYSGRVPHRLTGGFGVSL